MLENWNNGDGAMWADHDCNLLSSTASFVLAMIADPPDSAGITDSDGLHVLSQHQG